MSAGKEVCEPFFVIIVGSGVEYFVYEYVSWNCVEGLTDVYGGDECSVCWFGVVKAFECCLCDVCEEGCCRVLGSKAVLWWG